jgi:amidase
MRRLFTAILLACVATPTVARTVAVEEVSLDRLRTLMTDGSASSVDITQAYLVRIAAMDRKGPALHSVIAVNPMPLRKPGHSMPSARRGMCAVRCTASRSS